MFPIILSDNRFLDAAPTATGTAAGFNVLHLRDLRPYTFWQAAAAGTNYITVNCGSVKPADCLGMISHNLFTAGALVSVETSPDGISWSPRIAPFTPTSDRAFLKPFVSVNAVWFRIKIVTADVAPRIAVAMLGKRLEFPFPPDSPYVPYTESTEEESTISKAGHCLGTVVRYYGIEVNPSFSWPTREWLETVWLPFNNSVARSRKYFFYAWDLERYPDLVFFVKSAGKYETPLSVLAYVDKLKLQFKGVIEP